MSARHLLLKTETKEITFFLFSNRLLCIHITACVAINYFSCLEYLEYFSEDFTSSCLRQNTFDSCSVYHYVYKYSYVILKQVRNNCKNQYCEIWTEVKRKIIIEIMLSIACSVSVNF
jgi:hypothetical protein